MPVDPKDTPSQDAALVELAWALGVARDWPGFRDSKWELKNALYSWLVPALLAERRHVELMQHRALCGAHPAKYSEWGCVLVLGHRGDHEDGNGGMWCNR